MTSQKNHRTPQSHSRGQHPSEMEKGYHSHYPPHPARQLEEGMVVIPLQVKIQLDLEREGKNQQKET